MGRITRKYYNSAAYHVYNRGNNRQKILNDDHDKQTFLEIIAKYKGRLEFKLYGLVIMNNHYHMIIEANQINHISKIMQSIQLAYGSQYRKKYKFIGHLWQSRFKSRIIQNDEYILECLEYIHQNPVKAKIVKRAQDYRWSSSKIYQDGISNIIEEVLEIDRYGIGDTSLVTT